MSVRHYSTENSSDSDDTNNNTFNRALLMSDSQCLVMEESVVVTKRRLRSTHGYVTVNPTNSRNFTLPDQPQNLLPGCINLNDKLSKPKIINDEILSNPISTCIVKSNSENSTTHDNIDKNPQLTKMEPNFNKKIDAYLNEKKRENEDELQSPSSDGSSNDDEKIKGKLESNSLESSNIWPALTALEATFNKTDGNTSKNHEELIENLSEHFSYSPRRFTETLLTIIEASFEESQEISDSLNEFIIRVPREGAEGQELLEKISPPDLVVSQTSSEFSDAVTINNSSHSTQYLSLKKLMSPKVHSITHRPSPRRDMRTPIKVQRSNEISPIKSSAKKNYSKSPRSIKDRGTPKVLVSHRRAVVRASPITPCYGKSLRTCETFEKVPRILISPGTPQQSMKKNRLVSVQGSDDDDYLTAESESPEAEFHQTVDPTMIQTEEPVACSSRKLNMSSIAHHHQEWVQAFQKASQSVIHRSTASMNSKTDYIQIRKLEKERLRKLQQKRQQCLDMVDQLLEKEGKVDPSIDEKSLSIGKRCKPTAEFFNVLRACSEYSDCSMSKITGKVSSGYVSGLSINTKKNEHLNTRQCSIRQLEKKSPRKSLSKKSYQRIISPGAKCLSPFSKFSPKIKTSKGSQSPRVDITSLRPVSQVRCLFSPAKQTKDGGTSNGNFIRKPIAKSELQETSKKKQKFKHVVSPVAQYIRGSRITQSNNVN